MTAGNVKDAISGYSAARRMHVPECTTHVANAIWKRIMGKTCETKVSTLKESCVFLRDTLEEWHIKDAERCSDLVVEVEIWAAIDRQSKRSSFL